ncbi:hypothetical protein TTHERM_000335849 (macronuclear) [Tetrahymena thermophila SB210]|uniref:Uncharacterized protein n=1 Tax=Tetrahymena thermophila (strain SB210) TaxID=312017 RepID=W7XHT4_TETTS|nr:hypothetical protein TTHERM_000335849 [Tetrahymena thermophila SB210]EWS74031.1 hypothetical protein TTHERM_000335849 [Tetrahymena thermophila SB210]|eukprot:XP_012653430.1 hypothetical protein TTHERM_000335849 [Tetrahymena thermophila SB210]
MLFLYIWSKVKYSIGMNKAQENSQETNFRYYLLKLTVISSMRYQQNRKSLNKDTKTNPVIPMLIYNIVQEYDLSKNTEQSDIQNSFKSLFASFSVKSYDIINQM